MSIVHLDTGDAVVWLSLASGLLRFRDSAVMNFPVDPAHLPPAVDRSGGWGMCKRGGDLRGTGPVR